MGEIRTKNSQHAAYDWELMDPVEGSLIVKWRRESETTAGGLVRPETSLRWESGGEVLRLGPRPPDAKVWLEEGSTIYAHPLYGTLVFEGEEVDDSGQKWDIAIRIISWSDVLATMRKGN